VIFLSQFTILLVINLVNNLYKYDPFRQYQSEKLSKMTKTIKNEQGYSLECHYSIVKNGEILEIIKHIKKLIKKLKDGYFLYSSI